MSKWRPPDWEKTKQESMPDDPWLGFEAGADAMLERLRETAYSRQTKTGDSFRFISHPNIESELKSGCYAFIPDDEDSK